MERDQSEMDLRASEQLLRTTFDRAVVGIAHTSPEGRWLRFNQRLCDLVGYDREELAARTFQDVTHPDDLAASVTCLQRLLAGELDADELEKRYLRKDGTSVWVHVTVSLVRTPEGAPDYIITMVQDITEHKRLEQECVKLLEQERAARAEAEAAHAEAEATNAQLRALQALTDTALSHLALDDLLHELLGRVTAVMGVDTVSILLLDEDSQTLTVRAARGLMAEAVGRAQIPVGQGLAGRIAASRAPLIVDDITTLDGAHPLLRENLRSAVGVPLLVEDPVEKQGEGHLVSKLVGVITMGSAELRRFTEADVQLLQRAADRVALAIDRARLYAAEQDARRRAEAALARATASEAQADERAERLNTILETMTDGVFVYDRDGRVVQSNRAYRELFAADRLPGIEALPVAERIHLLEMRDIATGEALPRERVPGVRALRGEVVTEQDPDCRIQTLDGRELEASVCAAPLRDRDGRVVGAVSVVRDVTWRRRLEREREEALARAQASEAQATERAERLQTILETMADGVVVYDTAGYVLQSNRAYRELAAADRLPEYEALPVAERIRLLDMRDAVTGEPLPLDRVPGMRALRGEVVTGPEGDHRIRALDGREVEMNLSAAPLRDGAGRVVGSVSVLRDLTERKRLEREREAARVQAERQADQLDRIFEAAADGLIVWDAEGQVMRENAAARRILGLDAAPPGFDQLPRRERVAHYAARDEQGRPLDPEGWPFVGTPGAEVGTEPGTVPEARDVRMRTLDGREIELNVASAPLLDRDGRFVGAVVVLHDLTERRRLEREREEARSRAEVARADELAAHEANRRMEQFLATAAHDLRTPLSTTIGYLDLAKRQAERLAAAVQEACPALARQVQAVHTRLEDADQSAERLAQLLSLLFDTAAMRADRLELHRAPYDLAALMRECVASLRVSAPDRIIRLHVPADDAPVPVEVDAARIEQVVTNYVTNALKYAPPDRPIDVSVTRRGSRAQVAVRDRGPGIPKEEQARVWEPFHRGPGAAAQGGARGGTQGCSLGLGLHICKAIITAHGGRVGVKSAVGQGSTFWFTLPLSGPLPALAGNAP